MPQNKKKEDSPLPIPLSLFCSRDPKLRTLASTLVLKCDSNVTHVVLTSDPAQELLYQRRQGFGGVGPGVGQADAALLLPSILPSLLLLTLGALGAAYFSARLDVIEKETAERLHYLEDAIDTRLDRLEDEVKEGQKIDKKNDFKTKALCKLAGLFNNPLYDICQEGFDSTQIIGPSGHGGDGLQQF